MSRSTNRLTAIGIEKIKVKGRYADGGGLYLRVSPTINKSWVFRSIRNGIATEIGLGPHPVVTLADARSQAMECRRQVHAGLNPKTERERAREGLRTFGAVADEYLVAMAGRWTNEKTRWQWQHTLAEFSKPLRNRPVAGIDTQDILRLLKPIWQEKSETAAKARMRLENVLDYAKAKGWREGENPARWRGHLSNILPPRQKLTRGHHPAMPYAKVPAFLVRLRQTDAIAARGLNFIILTACRSGEVREAVWEEFDLEHRLWTIPAARMKTKRDHRIPLTEEMLFILADLNKYRMSKYVFAGMKPNKPLSNMAFEALMKRMKIKGASPHGFRSSFRDWCGDCTTFPREIAEAALAHKVGDNVELAYRRGDALEKRRDLMKAWGDHCNSNTDSKVVKLHR